MSISPPAFVFTNAAARVLHGATSVQAAESMPCATRMNERSALAQNPVDTTMAKVSPTAKAATNFMRAPEGCYLKKDVNMREKTTSASYGDLSRPVIYCLLMLLSDPVLIPLPST